MLESRLNENGFFETDQRQIETRIADFRICDHPLVEYITKITADPRFFDNGNLLNQTQQNILLAWIKPAALLRPVSRDTMLEMIRQLMTICENLTFTYLENSSANISMETIKAVAIDSIIDEELEFWKQKMSRADIEIWTGINLLDFVSEIRKRFPSQKLPGNIKPLRPEFQAKIAKDLKNTLAENILPIYHHLVLCFRLMRLQLAKKKAVIPKEKFFKKIWRIFSKK